jgi:hypothetical protein
VAQAPVSTTNRVAMTVDNIEARITSFSLAHGLMHDQN